MYGCKCSVFDRDNKEIISFSRPFRYFRDASNYMNDHYLPEVYLSNCVFLRNFSSRFCLVEGYFNFDSWKFIDYSTVKFAGVSFDYDYYVHHTLYLRKRYFPHEVRQEY